MEKRFLRNGIGALLVLLVFTGAVKYIGHTKEVKRFDVDLERDVPKVVGGWIGEDLPVEERALQVLRTQTVLLRRYSNKETGEEVSFLVIYAEGNREAFHPPIYCMTGAGSDVVAKDVRAVELPDGVIKVNELTFATERGMVILYNWYVAGELETENYGQQQLRIVLDQLLGRGGVGAMLRVSTVLGPEETKEDALARLERLMKVLIPALPKYLHPGGAH